jgi:predicted amidohydrolase YtcJ
LTFVFLHRNIYPEAFMSDLILYNANVITMDPSRPKTELVAVENGCITAVSSNEAMRECEMEEQK